MNDEIPFKSFVYKTNNNCGYKKYIHIILLTRIFISINMYLGTVLNANKNVIINQM